MPLIPEARVALLVSKWYPDLVGSMRDKCEEVLVRRGAVVTTQVVSGTFEFPYGTQMLIDHDPTLEAIVCLSVVVQGETKHFDMIVDTCPKELVRISCDYAIVVINGIMAVARCRSGIRRWLQQRDRSGSSRN